VRDVPPLTTGGRTAGTSIVRLPPHLQSTLKGVVGLIGLGGWVEGASRILIFFLSALCFIC
jgi:hypothetical protein